MAVHTPFYGLRIPDDLLAGATNSAVSSGELPEHLATVTGVVRFALARLMGASDPVVYAKELPRGRSANKKAEASLLNS